MQSLIIISLVIASTLDMNNQMPVLAAFLALVSIFSATQDIAADALAVTILEPEERGLGNSIQVAGDGSDGLPVFSFWHLVRLLRWSIFCATKNSLLLQICERKRRVYRYLHQPP